MVEILLTLTTNTRVILNLTPTALEIFRNGDVRREEVLLKKCVDALHNQVFRPSRKHCSQSWPFL